MAPPEAAILISGDTRLDAKTGIFTQRLRAFATCSMLTVALMMHAMGSALAQEKVLVPRRNITGGRLATMVDATGFPLPGELRDFLAFSFPSALAARGPDLYVADSGARKVYRFDADLQTLSVVPGIVAVPWTRLQVGMDQSLFALDAERSAVLHYSRGGRLLETLSDPLAAASLAEFVVDELSGQVVASDRVNRRLMVIHPQGWASHPLSAAGEGEFMALGELANAGSMMYAIDKGCSCIVSVDEEGRVRERIGQGTLVQPHALAADRYGHLFIVDGFDQTLRVFLNGGLIASYEARKLRVTEFSALAVDEGILYIADGPGAQVAVFHIRPPPKRRQ